MRITERLAGLLHAGTQHLAADPRAQRRLVVNNGVALALAVSGLSYAGLFTLIGFRTLGPLLVPISLLYLGSLALNQRGRFAAAKLLLLAVANTTVFAYLALFGIRGEVSVFFATVSLPLILCDPRERALIGFGFLLSIGYAFALLVAGQHIVGPPRLSAAAEHGVRVSLVGMTFAVMLVAILSFVLSNARAEHKLDRARVGLQRLLDSVDQGFVTLDARGRIGAERSSVFDQWFGAPAAGTAFTTCLGMLDRRAADGFATGWAQIEDGFLPLAMLIDQLPTVIEAGDRRFRVGYRPEAEGDRATSVLVVVSDVTAELAHERNEAKQRELLALLARFSSDRGGFDEFVAEGDRLVRALGAASDLAGVRRAVHTLKGNCALYGAASVAAVCHDVESRLAEGATSLPPELAAAIERAWAEVRARMNVFLDQAGSALAIDRGELETLIGCVRAGLPAAELAAWLEGWTWETAARRLARVAEQVRSLGQRLGKGDVVVDIDDGGVCFEPAPWASFWAAFAHVVRNAVDHGLPLAGAGAPPRVVLRTAIEAGTLVIEIADNGRGIDWAQVARKARERGLPTEPRAALEAALFADGVSTRDEVTELSGRGVGLGAVRRACSDLGGEIAITSAPGQGTGFRFSFARARGVTVLPASAPAFGPGRRVVGG